MSPEDVGFFEARMRTGKQRVEAAIDAELQPARGARSRLLEAMRYGVLNGGKRIRANLVYATGLALGAPDEYLDIPAMAVELVHAYSLVHDDLPAMDDDDLRRGQPTCHRVFDEATALLAGDALQTRAFELLSRPVPVGLASAILPGTQLRLCQALAEASGSSGMAGGQAIDLGSVGRTLSVEELDQMHRHKTGALIKASVRLGALCAVDPDDQRLGRLDDYADCIGLAFQIRDDVLDVVGDTSVTGKPRGSDEAKNKPTYPSIIGLAASEHRASGLHQTALRSLEPFGAAGRDLRLLSEFIVHRAH